MKTTKTLRRKASEAADVYMARLQKAGQTLESGFRTGNSKEVRLWNYLYPITKDAKSIYNYVTRYYK